MSDTTAIASPVTIPSTPVLESLNRLGVSMSGLLAQWLRGLTINAHERLALAHLWETGPMTMSELGVRIPLSRAAITALTDRLEALDYVRRTPDPHDRRRTVLTLTERPAALIEGMVLEFFGDAAAVEERFSADELRAVEKFHSAMRDLAHKHASTLRARSDAELPTPD